MLFFSYISTAQQPELISEIHGLAHCESVAYEAQEKVLYVSVMADKIEGDGKISKLSLDGVILDPDFITGLNDPKGIAINGKKLFVSNNTSLLEIDLEKGEITQEYTSEEARSLNDVTIDKDGNVFVSDMGSNSIFKLDEKGEFKKWLSSEELQTPNGLLAVNDILYVAGWASQASKETGNNAGGFMELDVNNKQIKTLTKDLGNLDGIQVFDEDSFLVSEWGSGTIFRIFKNGDVEKILDTGKSVGDILYLKEEKLLFLPMNIQNKLMIYRY